MPPFRRIQPADHKQHVVRDSRQHITLFTRSRSGLTTPQIRVLVVLAKSHGPLSRKKLSEHTGNKTEVMVGRALGQDDPEKRRKFETTPESQLRPTLQTLGYVKRYTLDIDGHQEIAYEITDSGRQALAALGKIELPPMQDSYEIMRSRGKQRKLPKNSRTNDSSVS